jgi:3'-phosphoadenosine 5'-phosphosulfate sulfotransferase (PAPS reductase)/FAD synthetase
VNRDPFKIDSPTCISFSGGRTSAYMLWRVLQSNGGLPSDAVVCFANTGKEDEATLRFVRDCGERWGVQITWVEYRPAEVVSDRWRVVDFDTASRDGSPFRLANRQKNYLPASPARYCTVVLKIDPARFYMESLGHSEWENLIGIRADEQRRVSKIRANPSDGKRGIYRRMPLADAGVTKEQVLAFWRSQPFDLGLPVIKGITMHGNCDLCFLKPTGQLVSLIAEKPSRAVWWIEEEAWAQTIVRDKASRGIWFRPNDPSYAQMAEFAAKQRDMFDPDEEAIACFCGD